MNSDRSITSLKKLRVAIRKKRPEKQLNATQLHHDNARPHISLASSEVIARMGWSLVPHPPNSPDQAPSDFHLFGRMKESLRGQHFDDTGEVEDAIRRWTRV